MRPIHEAIAQKLPQMSKSQRLLAAYIREHCDRAAFMSSFELAGVTGLGQSTVVRFAACLGYAGYGDFQRALEAEVKYRLDAFERFELMREVASDGDLLAGIAVTDALNIKRTLGRNSPEALGALATRLLMAARVYVFGQGFSAAAALYLSGYLGLLLPSVTCVNLAGFDPLVALSGLSDGDALILIGFPPLMPGTLALLDHAASREALVAAVCEGEDSELARGAEICLTSEWGDFGLNGSMAPLVSLCSALICMLSRRDAQAGDKLARASTGRERKV